MSTLDTCPDPVLVGGVELCVRPLERGDRATVARLFESLSERSFRRRFHGARTRLTESDLDLIASVDRRDRDAVVVFAEGTGRPVALGELVRDRDDAGSAEVAFAVADDWQGRGLGRILADRLARRARSLRVERVRAYVAASNDGALAVVRRIGRLTGSRLEDGSYELVVDVSEQTPAAG